MASTESHTPSAPARQVRRFRRLDLLVGIPLCWLATVLRRLGSGTRQRPEALDEPRRILLIKVSENGSIVLLASLFAELARRWPRAECVFLTFEENREVLDLVPGGRDIRVLAIDPSNLLRLLTTTLAAIARLRSMRIDVVLDFEHFSRYTSLLALASGAARRVGFHRFALEGLYRGDLFTHRVAYNPYLHTSLAFLGLLEALEEDPEEQPLVKRPVPGRLPEAPGFDVDGRALQGVARKLEDALGEPVGTARIFVLNPNASERIPIRKWPRERYVELARRLLAVDGSVVVLIGKGADRHDASVVHEAVASARCVDLCDQTDLAELLALFSISAALVTNDSGPAHFASLTQTSTVVLFGPETPVLYAPLGDRQRSLHADFQCSPCVSAFNHRQTPCERARCLEAIELDAVLAALVDLGVTAIEELRVG